MRIQTIFFLGMAIGLFELPAFAQQSESPLRIFGYFQNSLIHQSRLQAIFDDEPAKNSFSVQQLNLFFQKDLAENWRAFVNFEFLNNFSSTRQWGDANLEEAWVRYARNEKFNLKMGLMIPVFNNLNEIKNRTPLLPYIIRPIAYESSFAEFIATEEYLPGRAFVQTYGFLHAGNLKFDYAAFLGNSPNINNLPDQGQTGVDSTDTFLIGGRLGMRAGELKVGFSATRDNVNGAPQVQASENVPAFSFAEVPRTRLGGDFAYYFGKFSLESEFIIVRYDDDTPDFSIDKEFYYATLGYRISERLLVYASYWFVQEDFYVMFESEPTSGASEIEVPTIGFAVNLNERLKLKGQFAPVELDLEVPTQQINDEGKFNHYSIAVSVFF